MVHSIKVLVVLERQHRLHGGIILDDLLCDGRFFLCGCSHDRQGNCDGGYQECGSQ